MRQNGIAVAALALAAGVASADFTQSFSDSIASTATDWNDSVTFPLFDPALGTLLEVSWTIVGSAEGEAYVESLNENEASTVTARLAVDFSLTRPDATALSNAQAAWEETLNFSIYDGVLDFGGTSGASFVEIALNDSKSGSSTSASDLLLFTGVGSIDLPVSAIGSSSATGSGNLAQLFLSDAAATVRITYRYIPTPGAGALAAAGLLVVGRRRR